jgi:energy-converting hydrogenase Eha subunit G
MMDLAESLSHLNAALSKHRRSMAAEILDTTAGRVHLSSALITAEGCAHLAAAGVLARNNGFRLARSCLQLAICAGRVGLASAVAHAEAGFGDDADATILPGLILRVPETVTCSTVFIGRQPPPGVSEAAYLAMLCSTAVGQPAALEWLATVAKSLLHKYSLHGVSVARLGVAASACVALPWPVWV